ncbi:MAG: LuxR C-terminal-related transcriptional regulator [Gammaproteobacteria bacterium]|nr:LuxR C-terminal-related transcriptional regulator [Gammaproteobacteria bacterium]
MAKKLNLSPKTISTYRTRLFDKLKVHNEAEMTRLASRYGVLEGIE